MILPEAKRIAGFVQIDTFLNIAHLTHYKSKYIK